MKYTSVEATKYVENKLWTLFYKIDEIINANNGEGKLIAIGMWIHFARFSICYPKHRQSNM